MSSACRNQKQSKSKWLAVLLAVLMLAATISSCGTTAGAAAEETDGSNSSAQDNTGQAMSPTEYEDSIISLYENSIQAVVMIIVEIDTGDLGLPEGGQGSGFIIDTQGHIITNYHVVEDATKVTIVFYDDQRLEAQIIGTDRESDVALLQVDIGQVGEIEPLSLGDSDNVKPGQTAIALGSPFGLDGSITTGIISGVGRSLSSAGQRPNPEIVQTDAAINPGNSGGPLLNSAGEVVGINTAIEVSSNGIGFVVPINTVKSLLPALLEGGEVKTPWLGISAVGITPNLVELLNLPVSSGIYIVAITPGSPAASAGLIESGTDELGQPAPGGDIITAVDGIEVSSVDDLVLYLNNKEPGEKISLSINRNGNNITVDLTLGEFPEEG